MLSLDEIKSIFDLTFNELKSIQDKYGNSHIKDVPLSDIRFYNHAYADLLFACNTSLIEYLKDRGLL